METSYVLKMGISTLARMKTAGHCVIDISAESLLTVVKLGTGLVLSIKIKF